jgi:hypothetical protein
MLDSYISAIDGGVHDSETITETRSNQKSGSIGVQGGVLSAKGQSGKECNQEIKKDIQISPSAKFNELFDYLLQNDQAKYYQIISEDIFTSLSRDDFIEVLVRPRFSKLKELANAAKSFSEIADYFNDFMDTPLIDKDSKNSIDAMVKLGELKSAKTVACVFNFDDGEFPIIADLDEQYFCVPYESFVGEVYVLCKIQRKLQNGEKIELDEIFGNLKNIPLNREQRRKMPKKDLQNPKEFKDVVSGPAFTATVIAVYQ